MLSIAPAHFAQGVFDLVTLHASSSAAATATSSAQYAAENGDSNGALFSDEEDEFAEQAQYNEYNEYNEEEDDAEAHGADGDYYGHDETEGEDESYLYANQSNHEQQQQHASTSVSPVSPLADLASVPLASLFAIFREAAPDGTLDRAGFCRCFARFLPALASPLSDVFDDANSYSDHISGSGNEYDFGHSDAHGSGSGGGDHRNEAGVQKSFVVGKVLERVFSVFDRDGSGAVDFDEFVGGIALLVRGRPEDKVRRTSKREEKRERERESR